MSRDEFLLGQMNGTLTRVLAEIKGLRKDNSDVVSRVLELEKRQALLQGVGAAILALATIVGAVAIIF